MSRVIFIRLWTRKSHNLTTNAPWVYDRSMMINNMVVQTTTEDIIDPIVTTISYDITDPKPGQKISGFLKEKGIPFVFRCINRLDRDTSGLTIVAKHMVSAAILSRMVAAKSKTGGIHREYMSIVQGIVEPSEGVIDAPIARKESACLERVVDFEKGDRAVTHYRKIAEKKHTLTCHSNFFLETTVYNDSPFYNKQCIPVRTNPSTTFLLCLSEILSYKSSKLLLLQTKTAYS